MSNAWETSTSAGAPDPAAEEMIQSVLTGLGSPGSFFTATERLAFCEHARAARGLAPSGANLEPIVASAVARVAAEAMSTRSADVQAWTDSGRDVLAYIELVAVVARICSVDSYRIGLGMSLDPLPAPLPGDPVPVVAADAKTSNSWVPTVGIALAPTALSALPDETAAKKPIGKVFYLTDEFVHKYDVEPGRELTRPQMELVASRTSWLNECFF